MRQRVTAWQGLGVWDSVARELRGYRQRGLGGVLTEDTVRFATARALVEAGADPAGLRVEWPHPFLDGSRVDLVAGGQPPDVVIEFKFPREPSEKNAAWTMALGEVLKDLYRLAAYPGGVDRLFVYVETTRLARYMAGAARRYGLDLHAEHVALRPADAAGLPMTAARIIGTELAARHVTARRISLVTVDHGLHLAVYRVDPFDTPRHPAAGRRAAEDTPLAPVGPSSSGATTGPGSSTRMDGVGTPLHARDEILQAARDLLVRSSGDTFTLAEIIAEMSRRGTRYAESTIRTMVTGHMCANAPNNAAVTYDDLERVDRATYRLIRNTDA